MPTHRGSFGSRETNVSGLASRSSWAGRSSTAILSSRTLEDEEVLPQSIGETVMRPAATL